MDIDDRFHMILQSVLEGENEAIQQAFDSYTDMIINNTEELALIHFNTLSTTKNEQERTLTLILLGRYFSFLKSNNIILPDETSTMLQNMILSIYQIDNLTLVDLNILSNDIILSVNYFKDEWSNLPELLCELLNSTNQMILCSVLNCLSDIIFNRTLDIDQQYDMLFEYIQNALSTLDESNLDYLSSILQLFYSLANYSHYQPAENFIPIFSEIPKYLRLSKNNISIFNNFLTHVRFVTDVFENLYSDYFELFFEILTDPDFAELKYACVLSLSLLISSDPLTFMPKANDIFDIYTQSIAQDEKEPEISDLSKLYGKNESFAVHVFDYLKNNAPNPRAYIAFSSSFNGMKVHFINSDLSGELFDLFAQGFTDDDPFIRFIAFSSFKRIISLINYNEEWCQCSQKAVDLTLNVISQENNIDALYKEIKLLSELLKKFSLQFSEIIENLVDLLDKLTENCTSIEHQKELFKCYNYIASSYKEKFLPLSQPIGNKMMTYISDPKSYEDLFFICIEMLPEFNYSFPEDFFNELLKNSFQFLFTEIYNENGNENEGFALSDDEKLSVVNFLLFCLQKGIIDNSFELIENVLRLSFNIATKDVVVEEISKDSDLGYYENCYIITRTKGFAIIGIDQFALINNSVKILVSIFKSNEQIIPQYINDIYQLTTYLFNQLCFTIIPISNDFYDLLNFIFMLDPNIEELKDLLKASFRDSINLKKPDSKIINYQHFTKSLIDLIKIIGNRFKDDPEEISELLIDFFDILKCLFVFLDKFLKSVEESSEISMDDAIIYSRNHKNALINIALSFREMHKYFPIFAFTKIAEIIKLISEGNSTIISIVFSDFVHYCPVEIPGIFDNFMQYFKNQIQMPDQELQFDSIYALAIISTPKYFDEESMKVFINELLCNFPDAQNEIKNIIVFFILQVIQNYSSFFDVYDQFWILFDENVCLLPNYCMEYCYQSLNFLVTNFANEIPQEKEDSFQNVINSVKENLLIV